MPRRGGTAPADLQNVDGFLVFPSKSANSLFAQLRVLSESLTCKSSPFHNLRAAAQACLARDPYDILGVKPTASQREIKQAYLKASLSIGSTKVQRG